jgi:hypothetical protein
VKQDVRRRSKAGANSTALLGATLDTILSPNRHELIKRSFDAFCIRFEILDSHSTLIAASDFLPSPRRDSESQRLLATKRQVFPGSVHVIVPQQTNFFNPLAPFIEFTRIGDEFTFIEKPFKPSYSSEYPHPIQITVNRAWIISIRQRPKAKPQIQLKEIIIPQYLSQRGIDP